MTYPAPAASGYPTTSQIAQPGYTPTPTAQTGGQETNPGWVDDFVRYWVGRWDAGDHSVPQGWVSSLDGEPDDKSKASPRTVLAFTRYAMRYRPGMDPNVDQVMPWVAPGPNDYIEDPVVKAARIANDQWQKTFDEGVRQFGLNYDQTQIEQMRNAFNQAFQNELTKYATQANIFNSQTQAALNAYNTQAGIYNANEQNAGQRLSNAGQLASTLQTLQDARTKAAIDLKANPADYVQQAYATRALNGPQGTQTPAFKDVDTLTEVINRLINYKPETPPTAPVVNGGQPLTPPTVPNQSTFTPPPGAINPINPNPQSAGPKPAGPLPVAPKPLVPGVVTNPDGSTTTTTLRNPGYGVTHYLQPDGSYGLTPPGGGPAAPARTYTPSTNPSYTSGGGSQHWSEAQQRWEDQSGHYLDPTGTWKPIGVPAMAQGSNPMGTVARRMIVGDPQQDGGPNPEMVEVLNPGKKTRTRVTPFKKAVSRMPKFANGTDPNNPMLTTYDDSAYQNLPYIQYMQGNQSAGAFNTLAKGYATGAMGQKVPEAGSFNYRNYLNVARDPISLAMLSSDYKSANRDLASTLSRAKARAPFGQALNTSLVRT